MTNVRDPNNITLESLVEFTRTGVAVDMEAYDAAGGDVAAGGVLMPGLFNETPYLTYNSCILNNPLVNITNKPTCNECSGDPNALVPDWKVLQDGDIYFNERNCTYDIVKDCYKISSDGKLRKKNPIIGYPTEAELENLKEFAISGLLKEFAKAEEATAVIFVPDNFGVVTDENLSETKGTEYFRQLIDNAQRTTPGSFADAILLSGKFDDEGTKRQIPGPIKNFTRVVQEIDVVKELKNYLQTQVYVNISEAIPTKVLFSIEYRLLELIPQILVSTPSVPTSLYTQSGLEVTLLGRDFNRMFNRGSKSLVRAANFIDNLVTEQNSMFYIRVGENASQDVPVALDTRLYAEKLTEFKRSLLFAIKRSVGIRLKELEKVIISFDTGQSESETEDEETLYKDAQGNPIPTPPKIRIKNIIANKFGCPDVVVYDRDDQNYRTKTDINEIFDAMRDSTLNGYVSSLPDMLMFIEGKQEINWTDYVLTYTYPGLIVKDRTINPGDELSKCINTKSLNGLVNDLVLELVEFPNLFLNSVTDKVCNTKEELIEEENSINRLRRQIREQLRALATQSETLRKESSLTLLAAMNPETTAYYGSPDDLVKNLTEKATSQLASIIGSKQYEDHKKLIEEYEKAARLTQGIPYGDTTVPPTTKTFDQDAINKAYQEVQAVERAMELVEQYQNTTTKEIIKDNFITTTTKSLQRASSETSNKPLVNMMVQLILGAVAGEDSKIGAVLSTQTLVDVKGAVKLRKSGKKAQQPKRRPTIENAGDNKLAALLNNLNSGGGWCAWVAMIQEAAQCILKGLGITDTKTAIIKAALKKLTPFEWQKMFRNMPPEIRGRILGKITQVLPDLVGVLFPWEDNLGTGTFRPDLALQTARQQILNNAIFVNPKSPPPPPPPPPLPEIFYEIPVVHFDVAKYDLKQSEELILSRFVGFIQSAFIDTEDSLDIQINVLGHTSTTASTKTNDTLSKNRMNSVISYIEKKGVLSSNVKIVGKYYGETIPVVLGPEGTKEVKNEFEEIENRRAEIILNITPKQDITNLSSKVQSTISSVLKAQQKYLEIYNENAQAYGKENIQVVQDVQEIIGSSDQLGTTIDTLLNQPTQEESSNYYYVGSEQYPDSIYPGAGFDSNGKPVDDPGAYLKEYLAAGYGEDGLTLYVDPNDPNGYNKVSPPPAYKGDQSIVYGESSGPPVGYQTDSDTYAGYTPPSIYSSYFNDTTKSTATDKSSIYNTSTTPTGGLNKSDLALLVLQSEADYEGTYNYTDINGNRAAIAGLMQLSDSELLDRAAQAVYRQSRQDYINKRLAAGAGAKFTGALGEITSEAINIIIDIFIDLIGVDVLLEELNNLPGIGLVKKIIRDLHCIIPPMPYMKPTIEEYIKSARFDLCYIGQKGYKATANLSVPPILYGTKIGRPLHLKGWASRARKVLVLIGKKAADLLLDLLTQLLIKALVKVIETILDLTCSLVAEAAANLASMATKNTDFLTRLKNAICPDAEVSDQAFGEGLANVLEALYPAGSPESSCAASLSGPELAGFIDAIVVTLSYGQLYDLILGNPSTETLKIVSSIAIAQGGCISQIFGDPTNILNYFAGLGKLIGARDVFSEFPVNVQLTANATICPPNTFQTLRDLRQSLLEDKGLTPEQVKEQLDFLQDEAIRKLQDLSNLLSEGPFSSLEEMAVANQGCTFNGIIQDDPYSRNIRNNIIESIISPIEIAAMKDMIGADGAINMILADTNGADLKLHRARVRDFGNSIGQVNNLPHEYYSDNTIRKSYIDGNELIVVNNKKERLDQFGRTMPLAKTDKGPVGGYGPTIGGYLMNKYQSLRIGHVEYGEGINAQDIKQGKIEFKTKRSDLTIVYQNEKINKFNSDLFFSRRDRIAKFCVATGFIDAETAAPFMLVQPSQNTYDYTAHIKYYFDYTKRKDVFLEMINAVPRVFQITKINYPDYSPENRVERCLGQPKNPELREFSYSGDRVGLGYFMKEKIKNAYNNGDEEVEFTPGKGIGIVIGLIILAVAIAATGGAAAAAAAAAATAASTSVLTGATGAAVAAAAAAQSAATAVATGVAAGSAVASSAGLGVGFTLDPSMENMNTGATKPVKTLKFNREMMEYYLECWYAYDTEAEGMNDEERKKHYKPFLVDGSSYLPDTSAKRLVFNDSSELSFTYITYPKIYGGILGSGKADLAMPEYSFDLKYDFNIEDQNGNFRPEFKNQYSVSLVEKFNPFNDIRLKADQRQALKDYYNLIMSSPNTKNEDEESGDLEGYPNISLQNNEIKTFNKTIVSTPDSDVLLRTENLIASSSIGDIQYSFESEAFIKFLQEKLNQSDSMNSNINNFANTNTRNEVNNLFDFVNNGFVRRITSVLGVGDESNVILEFDDAKANNYEEYLTEKVMAEAKEIKVPKGFLFGYDPEIAPTIHILDPSKYGGSTENPPYYVEPPNYPGWMGVVQRMFPEKDGCEPARSYITSMQDLKEEYEKIQNLYANDERLGFDPLCTKEAPYDQIFQSSVVAQIDIVLKATTRMYLLEQMLRMMPLISTFQPNDNNFDELIYMYLADTILNQIKTIDMKRPFPERGPKVELGDDGKVLILHPNERRYTYFYGILEQAGYSILKKIDAGVIVEDTLGPTQQLAVKNIRESISKYYQDYDATEAVLSDESIAAQTIFNRAINGVISRKVNPSQGLGGSSFDKLKAKRIKKAAIYQALQQTEEDARTLFSIYVKEEFANISKIMTEKLEPSVEGLDLLFLSSPKFINGAVTKIKNDYGKTIGYEGPYDVMSDPYNPETFNIDLNKFKVEIESGDFVDRKIPISSDPKEAQKDININSKEPWPFVLERYITTEEPVISKIKDQTIYNAVFNRDEKLFGNINFNDWDSYIKNLITTNENFKGKISDFWGRTDGKSGWKWGVRLSMAFGPSSEYYKTFREVIDSMPKEVINKQKAFKLVNNSQDPGNYIILIPISFGELDIADQELAAFNLDQFDLPCTIMEMIKSTDFRFVTKYLFPQKRYLSLLGIYTANSFFDSIGNAGRPSEGGDRWTIPGGRRNSPFRKWDKGNIFYDPQKAGNDTANVMMNTFMALYRAKAEFASHTRNTNRRALPNLKDFLLSLLPDPILPDIPWFQRKNIIPRPYDMFNEECSDTTEDNIDEGEI